MQAEESRLLNQVRQEIRELKAEMREQLQQDQHIDQSHKVASQPCVCVLVCDHSVVTTNCYRSDLQVRKLKALRAREKELVLQLQQDSSAEQRTLAAGAPTQQDLIRTGKMTPFGHTTASTERRPAPPKAVAAFGAPIQKQPKKPQTNLEMQRLSRSSSSTSKLHAPASSTSTSTLSSSSSRTDVITSGVSRKRRFGSDVAVAEEHTAKRIRTTSRSGDADDDAYRQRLEHWQQERRASRTSAPSGDEDEIKLEDTMDTNGDAMTETTEQQQHRDDGAGEELGNDHDDHEDVGNEAEQDEIEEEIHFGGGFKLPAYIYDNLFDYQVRLSACGVAQ